MSSQYLFYFLLSFQLIFVTLRFFYVKKATDKFSPTARSCANVRPEVRSERMSGKWWRHSAEKRCWLGVDLRLDDGRRSVVDSVHRIRLHAGQPCSRPLETPERSGRDAVDRCRKFKNTTNFKTPKTFKTLGSVLNSLLKTLPRCFLLLFNASLKHSRLITQSVYWN